MLPQTKKRIIKEFLFCFIIMILLSGCFRMTDEKFIFFPSTENYGSPTLPFEEIHLNVTPENTLHAMYFPAQNPTDKTHTIIVCHGNAGNLSIWWEYADFLHSLNQNIIIFDYQGYGLSKGTANEENCYKDGETIYQYLIETKKVAPEKLIFLGISLGGAIATELASKHPAKALFLCSTFSSIPDMAEEKVWFIPFVRYLPKTQFNTIKKLSSISTPTWIFHSEEDEIIPFHQAQNNFAASIAPKKTFIKVKGSHNEAYYTTEIPQALAELLQK